MTREVEAGGAEMGPSCCSGVRNSVTMSGECTSE